MLKGKEPVKVSSITSRLVSLPGPSGMQIVGYVDEGPEVQWNERVVVLAPRYGETKKNNLQLSYFLAANGFKVFRFDQTNHIGESDGSMDQFTLEGVANDILASVDYVDRMFEPDEIILVTLSLSSRCGLRACSQESRISRFISLVGMLDMDRTLKAIYSRDIFGEFVDGASWKTIDILGFEIDAANFHGNLIESNMQDLSGTLLDAEKVKVPVIHLFAEKDVWVDRKDVEAVMSRCQNGTIVTIPGVGHEIYEKTEAAKFAFDELIKHCLVGLGDSTLPELNAPDKSTLLKQNKLERSRLQGLLKFSKAEGDFWGEYLGKFGIIEEAKYYVEYFSKMADLLGGIQPNDVLLDAGCGNGFYGVNIIRSLLIHSDVQGVLPCPIHYCGMDLTSHGLARSYSRHVAELVELQRQYLSQFSGVGFSYRKVDFDTIGGKKKALPFEDGSISKVCSSLVLSYLKQPVDLMKEFYRVLKPGGVAIVSSMKPGCDMTVLYHDSVAHNYSEENDRDAKVLLSAAGQIKLKKDAGIYQFFTAEELERLAFDSGFVDIRSFRSFGDQANVIRIVK